MKVVLEDLTITLSFRFYIAVEINSNVFDVSLCSFHIFGTLGNIYSQLHANYFVICRERQCDLLLLISPFMLPGINYFDRVNCPPFKEKNLL